MTRSGVLLGAKMKETDCRLVRIPKHVLSKRVQGETVVIDLESGAYFGLDAMGTTIWERMQEHRTFESIVEALMAEFAADRTEVRRDVSEFLTLLESKGLVVLCEVEEQ